MFLGSVSDLEVKNVNDRHIADRQEKESIKNHLKDREVVNESVTENQKVKKDVLDQEKGKGESKIFNFKY